MKKSIVFILILANNTLFACGFYPSNEDLRFSFFKTNAFGYYSFGEFNYSADYFYPGIKYPVGYVFPNEQLWFDYCKGKAKKTDITIALNSTPFNDVIATSSNSMIKYLFKTKDYEAITYLKFAKNSEFGNSWEEDPWERNKTFVTVERSKQIKKAIRLAEETKTEAIKFRYLFLAMRLAYYNSDVKTINSLFEKSVKDNKSRDIIYYWSLYFQALTEKNSALCNFYAAQVFANASDKRFMISQQYNTTIPIEKVLAYSKTNKEMANVYLLSGILKVDKSLEDIKKMQQLMPNSEGVSFLLLREINKLEDWVFTPYYSLFEPSTHITSWQQEKDNSIAQILSRVETDRAYAKELLTFINSVDVNHTDNPLFWNMSKGYLLFISKDYKGSLALFATLEKQNYSAEIKNQIGIIKALALTANQEYGKAIILDDVKPILLKNKSYQKFVFALGRELEYKGNTTDAALLYSLMNEVKWDEDADSYDNAFWKTKKNKGDTYSNFYDNYFDYLNVMYTPEQVQALINNVIVNRDNEEEFAVYKYGKLKKDISRLYDLLGTKYIRQNKLTLAMKAFRKVSNKLWNDKYTAWERMNDGWYYGNNVFDENPFYELKYTPKFIPAIDKIKLNKYTVTRQLIKYLNKANNPTTRDRDYYYFLVANCYYNMTQYGNCWMMRRYYWTSIGGVTFLEDEAEFHEGNLANYYYDLALKNAKTDKFKALCTKMKAKCETFKLEMQYPYVYGERNKRRDELILSKNKYYQDLKTNFPNYYNDLNSDCTFFKDYFKARR